MSRSSRLARYSRDFWTMLRGHPVAPTSDELFNVWTTLYGTPDVEKLLPTFEQFARNAFAGNSVVFGLMVRRMMLFTEATLALRNRKDKSLDQEAPALGIFRDPWPNGVTADLLARMIQDVDLAGNAYVRDAGDRLERLRPDWVSIVSQIEQDSYGREVRTVIGYVYEPLVDNSRHTEFYPAEEVAHWAPIPDPLANFRGMTWLTPVVREVNADIAMSEHAYAFYMNAATPNLIIKYSQKLKQGGLDRIRDQIAARHTGAANAFSTLVLDEGADPMIVGKELTDVSFGALQAAGENRLAVAAGVPAIVAGLKEGLNAATMANYREAMQAFANLTMRPLWRSACAALAKLVDVPEGQELWYDTRDIAALQQGEQELASTMQTNAATVSSLINAGYKPDSVVRAVTAGDLTLLEHTGLYSVQLRPPGSEDPAAGANGDPAAGGKPKPGDPNEDPPADPNEDPNEDPNAGTSKQDPNGATRAGWVWDIARGRWRPDLHPRDHHGRFRRVAAADLLDAVDVKALSDKRLFDLFGSVTADMAHGDESEHVQALQKLADEMDRRDSERQLAALRKENPLHGRKLSEVSDQELAGILHDHPDRPDLRRQIEAEQEWRRVDQQAEAERQRWALDWGTHQGDTLEQRRVDKAVSGGKSYPEAYADAYAYSEVDLKQKRLASIVDVDRQAGETRRQAVRRAYGEFVHLQYLEAEQATAGNLLSRDGKAAGVDPLSLFSGPRSSARKHASEELLRWWGGNQNRLTFEEFAAQVYTGDTSLLKDRGAKSAGSEFGV